MSSFESFKFGHNLIILVSEFCQYLSCWVLSQIDFISILSLFNFFVLFLVMQKQGCKQKVWKKWKLWPNKIKMCEEDEEEEEDFFYKLEGNGSTLSNW